MILTLEVTGPHAKKLGPASRKVFRATGGTIGRLPNNYWVLPDGLVSSCHAVIQCVGGVFYIDDKSRNGVFINSQENRLTPGQPYRIKSGDLIFIDPYEIRASITNEARDVPVSGGNLDDPFVSPGPAADNSAVSLVRPEAYPADAPLSSDTSVDPLDLLGFLKDPPAPSAANAADLGHRSPLRDHYQPPAPPVTEPEAPAISPGAGVLIPDNWSEASTVKPVSPPGPTSDAKLERHSPTPVPVSPPLSRSEVPKQPTPNVTSGQSRASAPSSPTSSTSAGEFDLAELLAGAGLDPAAVTPELARSFGQILRVVVSGVMDVLQVRQQTKEEFGMGMTTFKPARNNPLKFSANVDDALHNLLVKRNAAYLGPVDAFEDAFDDVRNHQMAMLAGVRLAFEAMLAQFDPDRLQEEFDRRKKGALVSVPAKLRYWDLYCDWIHDMVHDAEDSFRKLFGDEFAQAYEEQLKLLKAQGRSRQR
jgi:type VI secretion system FHA domain protein